MKALKGLFIYPSDSPFPEELPGGAFRPASSTLEFWRKFRPSLFLLLSFISLCSLLGPNLRWRGGQGWGIPAWEALSHPLTTFEPLGELPPLGVGLEFPWCVGGWG